MEAAGLPFSPLPEVAGGLMFNPLLAENSLAGMPFEALEGMPLKMPEARLLKALLGMLLEALKGMPLKAPKNRR